MTAFDDLVSMTGPSPHPGEVSDWQEVLRLARRNKLLPALANVPGLPAEVSSKLSAEAARKSLLEIHRAGQLIDLIKLFQENGIEVLSFKGLTLAQLAHGRISARECIDIDLLVKPRDFRRALALLLERGFRCEMSEGTYRCFPRFNNAVAVYNEARHLNIDLHSQLFSKGVHFPMEEVWNSRHCVEIQGFRVPTFRAEHLFVYLALHGTKHCWQQLRWLHDLKALLDKVDQGEVARFAKKQKCERALALGTSLIGELWGIDTGFSAAEEALVEKSLRCLKGERLSWPQYHRFQYRCQSSLGQSVKLFLHTWFSPQIHDLRLIDLPSELWFVYYALRPLRIVGETISKIFPRSKL